MSDQKELLTTNRKALTINLDGTRYGTIAEIGAGQEVARVFFQAGSASGSIAKTMSAYDMTFSDAIYGKAPRYVSRERLQTMLHHEYALLKERLSAQRGERTRFFVFANTVAAKSARVTDGHGWLGIRFQRQPLEEPHEIIIHVRMWDKKNVQQQEALGIVGTNLIYGAFYYLADPERLIQSLVDNVGTDRIEVDMVKFSGPSCRELDNRLLALHLVRHGLTNAVLFSPAGEMLQPSEAFFNRPVLVERGIFRPVTLAHLDMLRCATAQFLAEPSVRGKDVLVLMEIAFSDRADGAPADPQDYLARIDLLGAIGLTTLISNYSEYYRLASYFRRYTPEMIGIALGINTLIELFNERHYDNLQGGILESMGRMFKQAVKLYVYPMRQDTFVRLAPDSPPPVSPGTDAAELITVQNLEVASRLRHLYLHLLENDHLDGLTGCDVTQLARITREVATSVRQREPGWEQLVPPKVAELIESRRLFAPGS